MYIPHAVTQCKRLAGCTVLSFNKFYKFSFWIASLHVVPCWYDISLLHKMGGKAKFILCMRIDSNAEDNRSMKGASTQYSDEMNIKHNFYHSA